MLHRAILWPRNESLAINEQVLDRLSGDEAVYTSADEDSELART